ncbi:MAG: hypothetical protein J0L92_24675 [Deltaproteobacteria bacterium]|nr:hypothetical protein [Deltaproteobacteria bacterium]
MDESFDYQWQFVLNHELEDVRRIAEHASREPALRRLFPYSSLSNLRFSTRSEYPYDSLPWVETVDAGRYRARDADNRPLAEGDLQIVVMPAVVRAVRAIVPT